MEVGLQAVAGTAGLADSVVVAGVSAAEARGRVGKMRTKEFLSKLEHDQIVSAIREAESKTSGEIRVYVQRGSAPVVAVRADCRD